MFPRAHFACVALFSAAAAQAQTSVTIYGLLDAAPARFSRTAAADASVSKLNSDTGSSSRLGFRGAEDLGGGWAAMFNLESPIDLKSGTVSGGASSGACNAAAGCAAATGTAFWRRNSYVGFRGPVGEVTFGRHYTAAVIKQADTLSATPSGINTGMGLTLLSQGISNDFWNSNQVRYDSPRFGPISFALHGALGEGVVGHNVGGNVRYDQGPLAVSLSHQQDKDLAGRAVKWTMLSGRYGFGAFRLHLGANRVDNGEGVTGFVNSDLRTVGAGFKATDQLTVAAQYWTVERKVGASSTSKLLVLNADYLLSRRSALYVLAGFVDSQALGLAPLWGNGNFAGAGNVVVANDKANGLAVGMRHTF